MLILQRRWTRQPQTRAFIDRSHSLGQYATFALIGGQHIGTDACGNALTTLGDSVSMSVSQDGLVAKHDDVNASSFIYANDKNIGNLGSGDFTIFIRAKALNPSTATCMIGKGDTAASDWMFGSTSTLGAMRFYGLGGTIQASSSTVWSQGEFADYAATRVGSTVTIYKNGVAVGSDATSSGTLQETAHHLTVFSADYNGTTVDTSRKFGGEVICAYIFVGIGGEQVVQRLGVNPWALLRPRKVYIPTEAAAGGAPNITALSARLITANSVQPRISYS